MSLSEPNVHPNVALARRKAIHGRTIVTCNTVQGAGFDAMAPVRTLRLLRRFSKCSSKGSMALPCNIGPPRDDRKKSLTRSMLKTVRGASDGAAWNNNVKAGSARC